MPKLNMNGWNPIETAPTDSTPVLVWNGYIVVVGVRVSDREWEYCAGCEDIEPSVVTGEAWMPLPEPPR